jgi:transposase-like protein
MANQQRDVEKEAYWREVVQRQAASGVSVRSFCRQQQLVESAFYAWRRTIAERDGQVPTRKPPPAKVHQPRPAPVAFVQAVVTDLPAREASIALELAGGRVLRLPASTSVERLAQLITALEAGGLR